MFRLALRTLRFRKGGFIATFIAVFLGSAIVVACGGLMETGIRIAVPPQRLAAAPLVVTGKQTYVVPNQDPRDTKNLKTVALAERQWLDASLVGAVRGVPGVAGAVGEVSFPATVLRDGQPVTAGSQSLGHDWGSAQLAPFTLRSGSAPTRPGEVVLDAATAAQAGVHVGDQVSIAVDGGVTPYRVTGIAATAGTISQSALFFATADATRLNAHPGKIDAIGVLPAPGTDLDELASRIDGVVASQSATVLTGEDRGVAEFPEAIGGRAQVIPLSGVFAGMAVFIAMFVVASTLGLSVQQRQRELALLRAIGATPRQVRRMVVGEALVVALIAAILGCAPAVLLGPALYQLITSAGVITPVVVFHQGFIPYLAGPALALITVLIAAWVTGRRAGKTRPTEALAESSVQRRWVSVPRVLFAVIFFAMGLALFIITGVVMAGPVASATAGPAVMCWAISLALISPGVTKLVTALLQLPVRGLFGLAGYLGTINARVRAVRMAAAVTPIMLAVGMAVANFYTQTTASEAAQRYFADNLRADVTVTSTTGGFGPGVLGELRGLPGVAAVSAYVTSSGWVDKPYDGTHVESPWPLQGVTAQDAAYVTGITPDLGNLADLTGNTVALPDEEAAHLGVGVGATVTMRLGDRETADLRVVATYPAKAGYETILLPATLLAAHGTDGLPRQILVSAAPGTDTATLAAAVTRQVAGQPGAVIGDRAALNTFASQTQALAWANYSLVGLVTGYTIIAVANTLVMATAARRREFGLQRLIGSTRRQVMQMLGVEATLIAVIGIVLGTVASIATLMPFSIVVLGSPFPSGPLWIYLAVVVAAVAIAVASTLLPARKAMEAQAIEAVARAE
ncbi:MAG TPA: FtsX-like permease family protein [Amycolatopsis sp.]|nr:FtsX-like permease family protein [Amycolatopsis sp.]